MVEGRRLNAANLTHFMDNYDNEDKDSFSQTIFITPE